MYAMVVLVHAVVGTVGIDWGRDGILVRFVLNWVAASIITVFGFLLVNLIILHIYLIVTQQTTYQFLQRRKKEEDLERLELTNRKIKK